MVQRKRKKTNSADANAAPSRRIAAFTDPSKLQPWPQNCSVENAVRFHIALLTVKEMFLGLGVPLGVSWLELVENVYADPVKVSKSARAITFNLVAAPVFKPKNNSNLDKTMRKEIVNKAVMDLSLHFSNVKMKSVKNYEDKNEFHEVVTFIPHKLPENMTDAEKALLEFSDHLFEFEYIWDACFEISSPENMKRIDPTLPNSPERLLQLGHEMGADKMMRAWSAGVPLDDILVGF